MYDKLSARRTQWWQRSRLTRHQESLPTENGRLTRAEDNSAVEVEFQFQSEDYESQRLQYITDCEVGSEGRFGLSLLRNRISKRSDTYALHDNDSTVETTCEIEKRL